MKRFIGNLRLHRKGEELISDELTAEELRNAEVTWIKDAQQDMKSKENFDNTRESLNVIQQNEILICKGRLKNSELNEDTKYPIILTKNTRFTDLVILEYHSRVHHLKVRSILGEMRSRFWLTQGRQYVKSLLKVALYAVNLKGSHMKPLPRYLFQNSELEKPHPLVRWG